ncbi:MAG TPA: hypoxanthine phosphoribosyltransferase [Candidatus Monoglobus merdigallinarum]|uniref:Hypoxanthine phosphoribosyltransferase n=1 Tax=Candidatus Monoglobus merdigallinarum TaxID=2838698 RepID=A0A9D1PR57_9FIRM|nr:hypoxanthine phosphoribosyltransferase [Candidatus Monoglobus merdigallinarum]
MKNMKIKEILMTEEEISGIVSCLADRINNDCKNCDKLTVICVLKGAAVFASDLIRKLSVPDVKVCFIKAESYGSAVESSGSVKINSYEPLEIQGEDVLIVEDIVDTGHTLSQLTAQLKKLRPRSLKVCTMFDKPTRRCTEFVPDYAGAEIPNEFIVGYGLDFDERYRNLPYVAVLDDCTE